MPSSNVSWGIDIGAGAIKAMRLEREGDQAKVGDFVVVPHKRVLSTPDIVEADAIRVALGSFLGEYRDELRGASVVCSLPGHATFARFAKLPPVEAKGVENLVRFEAVQQIPFPIEEVEWDYQVFASEDSPEVEVGIFAVTRDRVNEKLSLWGETGLAPDQITLGPVAAYNAIAYDLGFTEDSPGTVIVDIGTVATDLIIAERGRVWIRTFPIGGHHFTEVLSETFKLNYAKAEKLKGEAETSKYKRHIFQALKPILTDLVQDVQRSISYYQETHERAKLERVIGLGSTFRLLGLRKLMSQQLGIEVYRLEGFKRTTVEGSAAVEFDAVSLNMATAYGLALQGLGLTPISANLVPVSVTREVMWRTKTPYFVTAATIGLIGGASTFVQPLLNSGLQTNFSGGTVQSVDRTVNELRREWDTIQGQHRVEFLPSNASRLYVPDAQAMHLMMLADVRAMLDQAKAEEQGEGRLYRLFSFDSAYLAPGSTLETRTSPTRGPSGVPGGRNPFGGSGDGRDDRGDPRDGGPVGPGAGAGSDTQAGAMGAFRVTLELDSANGELPVFNDAVLEWLRDPMSVVGRHYRIVGVPTVESVPLEQELTPTTRGDDDVPGEAAPSGPGRGAQGGNRPPPRTIGGPGFSAGRPTSGVGGGDSRGGAGGRDPRGPSGAPGGDGAGFNAGRLDAIAPLGERERPFADAERVFRYTLTYFVQRQDEPVEPPAPEEEASESVDPNGVSE